ncbi:HesA/MoeB/ThiF family protein [Falsigemmobacter faecalis]|uniref:Molybdopterin-synthase adenylyltransferase n=1 Tax=Falsigemmobacter faecalis TaxID=2488730 RepID=A0A3P3DVD9_9RHOB|nr:HesA/MoeB/ThiF family protein [Falsigemmobacter faecalis]RRH76648.1 HesA/MoeB/ThiF family protein [Falsigemmobacter faecalis]
MNPWVFLLVVVAVATILMPKKLRLVPLALVFLVALQIVTEIVEGRFYTRAADFPERLMSGAWIWWSLGLFIIVLLAKKGLRWIRARAPQPDILPSAAQEGPLQPVELERYSRHLLLREVGGPGQVRLKNAKVLVVGAGGLGSPVILYLAAAGVGEIFIADDDRVENSNLQRQIIHTDQRLGEAKAVSAAGAALALNPFIKVHPLVTRLDETSGPDLIAGVDLVLDGTDNFDTRYLVNTLCVAAGKPLISAAITQWEGQISLYHPAGGAPCYACVFPTRPADGLAPACSEAGVIAPLPGVVGSLMALEAVKYLTGAGQSLKGRLMMFDGLWQESRTIGVKRRADCKVCGVPH